MTYAVAVGIGAFLLVLGVYSLGNIVVSRPHRTVELLLMVPGAIVAALFVVAGLVGGATIGQLIVWLFLLLLFSAIYFLPSIVATRRRHRQQLAIFVLNLFTGWTIIAWIVAVVWACTADVEMVSQVSAREDRFLRGLLNKMATASQRHANTLHDGGGATR